MDSFASWESEAVGFNSTWKANRQFSSSSMQTEEIKYDEKNLQSTSSQPIAVQTDFETINEVRPLENEPYPPSLYAFFAKVTDQVCKYLVENQDPFASEVFKDLSEDNGTNESVEATKEYTLKNANIPSEMFGGSCLSWNKAGTQIAVGYSAHIHPGWCCHQVPLSVWNLSRRQNFDENVPHAQVLLPSCATSLDFHPLNPSVVAVGLHSGEVALVDLFLAENPHVQNDEKFNKRYSEGERRREQNSGQQLGDLGYFIDGSGHVVRVTSVQWIRLSSTQISRLIRKNKNPSPCCLLSAGKDGYICLWSTNTSNTRLVLEKKFVVWSDIISEDIRIGNRTHLGLKDIGVLGLSSCKDDPFAFVVTCYGGFIFQGNLDGDIEAYTAMAELSDPDALTQETLYDPGVILINKHEGLPKVVHCSPFHRNIFLSATRSGSVIIQNLLEPMKPMAQYDVEIRSGSLNDAKWSGRPSMFAVAYEDLVKVYDLRGGPFPSSTIIVHEDTVTQIAFNHTELGSLATCDIRGAVHIWKLPSSLSSHEPDELDVLTNLNQSSKLKT